MKLLRIGTFLSLVIWSASNAWGQLGLYGSPQPLQLQQAQPVSYGDPVTANSRPGLGQPSGYVPRSSNTSRPYYQTSAQTQPAPTPAPPRVGGYRTPTPATAPAGMPALSRPMTPNFGPVQPMLNEPPPGATMGNGGFGGCNGCDGPQCGGLGGYSGCDGCGGICFPWYVSLRALVMTRDKPNTLSTSAEEANLASQGHFDDFDWRWGGEVTVGRRFNCCGAGWGIEATYWTLDESGTEGGPGIPGPYVTPLFMYGTDIVGTGTTAGDWFNGSPDHHIARSDEVHNIEINLLRSQVWGQGCDPLNVEVLIGARYFRFRDRLMFSAQNGNPGTYDGDWIHLDDDVANELIGGQIGVNAQLRFAPRWKVFVLPKVGLYSNKMNLNYNLYANHDGTYLQGSSSTYQPLDYPVHSTYSSISVLTQVDVGVDWDITPHWQATVGYRLVAVTGIALADNQVPSDASNTLAISQIDKNGSLILHGAFAGLTYRF